LREELPVDQTESLNKRLEDILSITKNNRKKIEELDNKCTKTITDTKRNIETSFHKALDELREQLANSQVQSSRDTNYDDSRLNSVKEDIKDLYHRSREDNERISKLEKLVAEHDDLLNRVVKSCEGKANKKDHKEVVRDVKRIDETLKQLLDHVNTLQIPAPVISNEDGSKKYQELERIIVALEEKLDRVREALNQRMNDINKFMDMIKEDLDKTLEDQNKQLMKTLSKTNV
jgi:vacuolar-type H+-ATPase subunit I/STV1